MSISSRSTPTPLTCMVGIQYAEADGIPLYLDLLYPYPLPDKPLPTVVDIPLSAWNEAHRGWAMSPSGNPFLAAHGFATASASVRLSQQAPFPAQLHDAKAIIRWLRANAQPYSIDPEHIGVWGSSASGHLASLLGLTADYPLLEGNSGSPGYSSQVQAVMTICAPSDFLSPGGEMINDAPLPHPVTQLFGGTVQERRELMRLASPLTHVNSDAPRFSLSMVRMMRPFLLNKGNVCTKLFKLLGLRRPSFRYKMPIIICVKTPLFPGKAISGVQWVSWVYISSNNISADKQKQVWGEKRED